ncbi:MAG: hypothetical protein ACK4NA_12885 [Alphaproteobacteria bacterium]
MKIKLLPIIAGFLLSGLTSAHAVTWNPSDKGANVTLTNGNLTASGSGMVYNGVRATVSRSSGKYCYEAKQSSVTANSSVSGFATSSFPLNTYLGQQPIAAGYQPNGHTQKSAEFTIAGTPGVTFVTNDIMTLCVDLDAKKIWIGKNGGWLASGDPANGTNPWLTYTASLTLFPAYTTPESGNAVTANFGATAFTHPLPEGFLAWDGTEPQEPEPPPPVIAGHNECVSASTGSGSLAFNLPPGGRLTPESCTPVALVSHASVETVYYTGYQSWRVPVCNGTACVATAFPQLELTLDATAHPVGKVFDVFVVNQSGLKLCTSPAWTDNKTLPAWARGLTDGIETNKTAISLWCAGSTHSAAIGTATFVGTIYTTENGKTAFDFAPKPVPPAPGRIGTFLGIWNAYNRVPLVAANSDGSFAWSYNAFPSRMANNNPHNRIWWVDGRAMSAPFARYDTSITYMGHQPTGATVAPLLDWQPGDMGRWYPGSFSQSAFITINTGMPLPSWSAPPAQLGLHNFTAVEYATTVPIQFEGTQFIDPNNGQPFTPNGSWASFSTLSLRLEM